MKDQFGHGSNARGEVASTPKAFTGKRSFSVDLTVGKWFFAPGSAGPKTYFSVAG